MLRNLVVALGVMASVLAVVPSAEAKSHFGDDCASLKQGCGNPPIPHDGGGPLPPDDGGQFHHHHHFNHGQYFNHGPYFSPFFYGYDSFYEPYYDPYYHPIYRYRSYGLRMSCSSARASLVDRGYRNIVARDCSGSSYVFAARKNGKAVVVTVSSRSGRILAVRRR
jgi:hypothetical protein